MTHPHPPERQLSASPAERQTHLRLTPAQVRTAGYLLWGANWTERMALSLKVSTRFLQRVNQAAREGQETWDFPPGFIKDLRDYAENRATKYRQAADALKEDQH